MTATLLSLALLVSGYGEKDIVERIEKAGGSVGTPGENEPDVAPSRRTDLVVHLSPNATDADLGELCELRRLEALGLGGTRVTDTGLEMVSRLRNLERLSLNATEITDEGLLRLESLSNLRALYLFQCPKLTDDGVARLQRALPNCKIRR
jgi:hypothetical protein